MEGPGLTTAMLPEEHFSRTQLLHIDLTKYLDLSFYLVI